jgi:ABC-type sulfate transport system permease subunit
MGITTTTHQISRAVAGGTGQMPQEVEIRVAATALAAALAAAGFGALRAVIPLVDAWPHHEARH